MSPWELWDRERGVFTDWPQGVDLSFTELIPNKTWKEQLYSHHSSIETTSLCCCFWKGIKSSCNQLFLPDTVLFCLVWSLPPCSPSCSRLLLEGGWSVGPPSLPHSGYSRLPQRLRWAMIFLYCERKSIQSCYILYLFPPWDFACGEVTVPPHINSLMWALLPWLQEVIANLCHYKRSIQQSTSLRWTPSKSLCYLKGLTSPLSILL